MSDLARRGFLKALGVAPAAGASLVNHLKQAAAFGLAYPPSGIGNGAPPVPGNAPEQFKSVASWWEKFGRKAAERESRYVNGFDPDILEMRLPMATKHRMQRARNHARMVQSRWDDMTDRLSLKGVIEWWS